MHRRTLEQDRTKLFRSAGYETLVIWEHELENLDIVKNKIQEFLACHV